jgi:hypothetical protein
MWGDNIFNVDVGRMPPSIFNPKIKKRKVRKKKERKKERKEKKKRTIKYVLRVVRGDLTTARSFGNIPFLPAIPMSSGFKQKPPPTPGANAHVPAV